MKKLTFLIYSLFCLGIAETKAQLIDLFSFDETNGAQPTGSLILSGNKLYGMTEEGGANGWGEVFSIDTNLSGVNDLLDFNFSVSTLGATPSGSLTLAGKVLYGMTEQGGANDSGCIFSIDTNGNNYKDLFDFNGSNGKYPVGTLTLWRNKLYGMTYDGGANYEGCIFSIDTDGSGYNKLLDFNGVNGANPAYGLLTLSGNTLYGMTSMGGANDSGCIFSIDTNGNGYKKLLDFNGVNGEEPEGSLTLSGSKLFGVTLIGGANFDGVIFSIDTNGSEYKKLLDCNTTNSWRPEGSLTIAGNVLFGMTAIGGTTNNMGNIFSIDTNGGNFNDLLNFNLTDGWGPMGSLTLSGNVLYGATFNGGSFGKGVLFKFDTALATSTNNLSTTSGAVNIYPNPNNGSFTLLFENVFGNSLLQIYNIIGEKVYSAPINNPISQINISNNPKGIYLYRVLSEDGMIIANGKIIIL